MPLPQVSLPTQYNGKNQDPVGALSGALARLQANRPLRELREIAKGVTKQLPEPIQVCVWASYMPSLLALSQLGTFKDSPVLNGEDHALDLCADSVGCWSQEATAKIDEYARGMISGSGSTLFEELGLYYIGPIDGHNLELLVTMLQGMHPFPLCVHLFLPR